MMGFLILAAFILVFLMIATSVWLSGVWAGLITLVNFILAALVASSFYNAVALQVVQRSTGVEFTPIAEFLSFWLLLVLSFLLLRIAAELLTKHQLVFDKLTDAVARSLISLAVAVVFCSVTLFSLHMAPLPVAGEWHDSFDRGNGGFGIGLDRAWGEYCRYASTGPLRESPWTSGMLCFVRPMESSGAGEKVRFSADIEAETNAGSRYSLHIAPTMDAYRRSMQSLRSLVAEHVQVNKDAFQTPHDDLSTNERERLREEANEQLERLSREINLNIQKRAYMIY